MEQENKTAESAQAQENMKPEELLKRLTESMSQTDNPELAKNIQVLTLWTANIQLQNNELKSQMAAMQKEIAFLKQSPVKRAFQTAVTAAKNSIHEAGEAIQNIFENSDFIYMLNQAGGDRQILAKQLNISPHQLSYVTNSNAGEGLLFYGNVIIPFVDHFPKDTQLYSIMTTRVEDLAEQG